MDLEEDEELSGGGLKKAKIINYDLTMSIFFKCPHCQHEQKTEYSPSPYSAISDDPVDEQCDNCKEFMTIQI